MATPAEQINGLIVLYNQGRLQETLEHAAKLAEQYPNVSLIPNVLGAVNAALGRLDEAVASYAKALQIEPDFVEAHYNLGNALYELGKHEEAISSYTKVLQIKPDFTEAHYNLGNALNDLGRYEDAIASFTKALQIKPDFTEAHNNLAKALNDLGRHEDALVSCTKALQIKPDFAEAHINVGIALNELGKHEKAIASYTKALQLKPDFAEAHNSLGKALNDLGRHKDALTSCTKALQIKSDYDEAHNNLGIALNGLGKHEEAISSYTKALQLKPDFAVAHNNLGIAFMDLGRHEEAIASYTKALARAPDCKDFWHNLSVILSKVSFEGYSRQLENTFLVLLEQETIVRPSQVTRSILSLLKPHPLIDEALQILAAGGIQKSAPDVCAKLSKVPLFLRIIELCPIPDLEVESLLTELRRALLLSGDLVFDKPNVLGFQTALALHCFTNEFVFSESKGETTAVEALKTDIEGLVASGAELDPFKIACLASYRPLHSYTWSYNLTVSESLKGLCKRQINEVLEEASIRPSIPRLKQIEDQVSKAVREQYEENPYPQWVNTQLIARPLTISAVARSLELKLIDDFQIFSDQPDILVAGCGTGQHSLGTASRFSNSQVLAVDLSLSSLSYAVRKTRELGVSNIDYMQADILDLESLNRQFDIVESMGVLHHMADPMAGWKVLANCLKLGGLMRIGLYSELSRKPFVEAQGIISTMGLNGSYKDIKIFRERVFNQNVGDRLNQVAESPDFYSVSACRDLLFHVQEHRFTLPQIKEALDALGLTFVGFEFSNEEIRKALKQDYPDPQAAYSLDAWHEFETANPNTFPGMYQFWVQKNG